MILENVIYEWFDFLSVPYELLIDAFLLDVRDFIAQSLHDFVLYIASPDVQVALEYFYDVVAYILTKLEALNLLNLFNILVQYLLDLVWYVLVDEGFGYPVL